MVNVVNQEKVVYVWPHDKWSVSANSQLWPLFQSYVSTDHVEKKISAEELVRFTKPITTATAKAVAAGNSCRQEDAIVAANTGRKAISDLLRACKVSCQWSYVAKL